MSWTITLVLQLHKHACRYPFITLTNRKVSLKSTFNMKTLSPFLLHAKNYSKGKKKRNVSVDITLNIEWTPICITWHKIKTEMHQYVHCSCNKNTCKGSVLYKHITCNYQLDAWLPKPSITCNFFHVNIHLTNVNILAWYM